MSDSGKLVLKLSLGGQVFEPVDIFLESIVGGPVLILAGFLEESGYVPASFHFGVKGIEVLVVVCCEFLGCLFLGFDFGVGHFIIPFL